MTAPRLLSAQSTAKFFAANAGPCQVVEVRWQPHEAGEAIAVTVDVGGRWAASTTATADSLDPQRLEIGVGVTADPGSAFPMRVAANGTASTLHGTFTVAEAGWRMFMVSHFHYDPVFWTTQAAYLSEWDRYPRADWREEFARNGMELVDAHLDLAEADPDYTFVLAELDYLKPYWASRPERRGLIRRLIAADRLELVGGMYNEANTNLTSPECAIRNAQFGIAYQRDVLGGDPATAWQLDVFGHDPSFPSLMRDAGLSSSSWGRGPFHEWGPMMVDVLSSERRDPNETMQFAAEFDWMAPDGQTLLTHYMPAHYGAGWAMDSALTLQQAEDAAYELFLSLAKVAATRNILLPVGTDFTPPNRWVTAVHRHWNSRYMWPRFECALPKHFFAAVRAELQSSGHAVTAQSRDMNPIFTGKDVTYIDTKQAHRSAENTLLDAEKFATLASIETGCEFPLARIDLAWRQLVFCAHHDGITGSEGDQVYIDLLTSWREALEEAAGIYDEALSGLADVIDTRGPGEALITANPSNWPRAGLVSLVTAESAAVLDESGNPVPAVVTPVGGAYKVEFVAPDLPPLGYRTFRLIPGSASPWAPLEGPTIATDRYEVTADPARGGALTSIVDKVSGRELVTDGRVANDLVRYDEYVGDSNEMFGPWLVAPKLLAGRASQAGTASVTAEQSAIGQRLTISGEFAGVRYLQRITVLQGATTIDFSTRIDGFAGSDQMFRVEFGCDVPGGRPLFDIGRGAIARSFGHPDVDAREHPYTLDNPAYQWFGLGLTAAVRELGQRGEVLGVHALGVAEIVIPGMGVRAASGNPELEALGRDLVGALAIAGVTATMSRAAAPRYGNALADSNIPDFRVLLGSPEGNTALAEMLAEAGPEIARSADEMLAKDETLVCWLPGTSGARGTDVPSADVRSIASLPALVIAFRSIERGKAVVAAVAGQLSRGALDIPSLTGVPEPSGRAEDRVVALINSGTPGSAVDPAGVLHMSLLRSSTGFPAGFWADEPRRTLPDGASFQSQHWSQDYTYSLFGADGDWRESGLVRVAHDVNHPLRVVRADARPGRLPPAGVLADIAADPGVIVTAVKPRGNPLASGGSAPLPASEDVVVRGYESHGRPAIIRPGALARPTRWQAWCTGTEEDIEAISGLVELGPRQQFTLAGRIGEDRRISLSGARHSASYARYWLHNDGPAPLGNQPLSVFADPARALLRADSEMSVTVTASSELRDRPCQLRIDIDAPAGWHARPTFQTVTLAPAGYTQLPLVLRVPAGAADGTYFVGITLSDDDGEVAREVVTVDVGRPGDTDLVEVSWSQPEVRARPGRQYKVELVVSSHAASDFTAAVRVVSPLPTWEWISPYRMDDLVVPAGRSASAQVTIAPPPDQRPGAWWMLAKVAVNGRLWYLPSIPVVVAGG